MRRLEVAVTGPSAAPAWLQLNGKALSCRWSRQQPRLGLGLGLVLRKPFTKQVTTRYRESNWPMGR